MSMDKQTMSALISDLDGLKALLLEQSLSENGTAITSSTSADKLLKRIAKQCKQKLSACEQRRKDGKTSSSSDSGEDKDVVSNSASTEESESIITQPQPVVALKLRPLGELLKPVDTIPLDSSDSESDSHTAAVATANNKSKSKTPATKSKSKTEASGAVASTSASARATTKSKSKNESNDAGTAAAASKSKSKTESSGAGASTSAAAKSKSNTVSNGAGSSTSTTKPKSQTESNSTATIHTKRVQVTLTRLPDDLTSLLSNEGLHKEMVTAQFSETVMNGELKKKGNSSKPKSVKFADSLVEDSNTDTPVTMPRKRAAPQKIRVEQRTNSDDEEEEELMVPIARTPTPPAATAAETAAATSDEEDAAMATNGNTDDSDLDAPAEAAVKSDDDENEQPSSAHEQSTADDSDDDDFTVKKRKRQPPTTRRKKGGQQSDSDSDAAVKPSKKKRRRIKKTSDDDDDEAAANSDRNSGSGSGSDDAKARASGRKNIRKVIKNRDLESETKRAAREEMERKKRIEERQKLYNSYYDGEGDEAAGGESGKPETVKVLDHLILDFDEKTKEALISVDAKLVRKLKPHQGNGVKFMWDTCFESIERIQRGPGSGCILAHCMGLGKSLQVVTLVHTLLAHSKQTGVEKVLVICPLSTVLNWVNEFKIWLRQCAGNRDIEIYEISKYKQNAERVYHINEWHEEGGVLIMGYDLFRNISSETSRLKKREKETVRRALVDPGADLVVCDEGHLLKNSKTSLSKAVNRVKTLRRVVLTGTPLQNNLNEYYCMVQFVKPNLLGKYNEYLNRFVNPITNGQYVDSTPFDIQMMKRRSHILHKLLDGSVQRRDYEVLAPYLPVKHEYVVYVQLTPMQIALYRYYMEHKPSRDDAKPTRSSVLFQDFQNLQRIWTHPRTLRYNSDRFEVAAQKKRDAMSDEESEGSIKNFLDDSSDEEEEAKSTADESDNDEDAMSIHSDSDSGPAKKRGQAGKLSAAASARPSTSRAASARSTRRTRNQAEKDPEPEPIPEKIENPTEWWMSMCPEDELDVMSHSGKLMLIFSLLEECEMIGDKLLVFSQSLYSLDVIENFLARIDDCTQRLNKQQPKKNKKLFKESDEEDEDDAEPLDPEVAAERKRLGGFSGSWSLGLDYFRLDGSTNIEHRNQACKTFNRDDNPRARLFLISTRAGGLGINLVAANRVVIFDVSWNPSHDIQSIFRVYRFGQKKPCYIYRFIAMGTMEEKVYERQVTKLSISKRVIDEHQIDRHYKANDLMELYKMDLEPTDPRPTPILPKDRLFAGQLQRFSEVIYKYHEHDSLLENKREETLDDAEIKAAWEEFEAEKVARPVINYAPQQRAPGMGPVTSNHIFGIRSDVMLHLLRIFARKTYPMADENQVKQLVPLLHTQLYEKMQTGDTSMLQQLMVLQTELEAPNLGYNQMINQMVNPQAMHSAQQQQQLHQHQLQQQQHQHQQSMMANSNPFNMMSQMAQMTPQQQMIAQAQNRLLKTEARQQLANRPPPTHTSAVIELD